MTSLTSWTESEAWQAVRFERAMSAGRTRPVLLDCTKGTKARRQRARFVTKGLGLPEINEFSLAHELVGARLASALGLAAPASSVIVISPAFLEAIGRDLADAGVRLEPGLAGGSEFIPNLNPFPPRAQLSEDEIAEAAAIYAFDLLTQNPDRSLVSPNCGRAGRRLVPYDFESAFSFRLAVLKADPWRVGHLPFARQHLFYQAVRTAQVDWPAILQGFSAAPVRTVTDLCSTIPEPWTGVGQEILAHVASVLDHWPLFEQEVAISLGNVQ